MSLFENDQYQWRETFFVLFHDRHRPQLEDMLALVRQLGKRYRAEGIRQLEGGHFEAMSIISPDDFAAMDLSYVTGEDVTAQIVELRETFVESELDPLEKKKLAFLDRCNVRYDVYHFEQLILSDEEDEEELLDPGGLLLILAHLAKLCKGVAVDPQSATFI